MTPSPGPTDSAQVRTQLVTSLELEMSGPIPAGDYVEQFDPELAHHRADDAPPYFTILIVGHVLVPLMIVYDRLTMPPLWHQMLIATFGTLAACLILLPRIKGALVAFQWAKEMHGFGDEPKVHADL